jgi:hypothetical protein
MRPFSDRIHADVRYTDVTSTRRRLVKVADDADEPLYQLNLGSCAEESCLVAYLKKSTFSWADFETTGMTYLRGSSLLASLSAFYSPGDHETG